ncbi:MAG TPA: BON domain-containing protein [Hydrogenophaga sp.]|nr:BON domain-containing protein [Hydrogenophaga sp.]
MSHSKRYTALIAAAAAAALMAACGQSDNETVGQEVDRSTESVQSAANKTGDAVESAANETGAAIQEGARDLQAAGTEAGAAIAETATDVAITTKVEAALAADGALSAMDIEVDTEAGRVALIGTAPDETAKERATSLVTAIEGVVAVENRLIVEKNS